MTLLSAFRVVVIESALSPPNLFAPILVSLLQLQFYSNVPMCDRHHDDRVAFLLNANAMQSGTN